MLAAGLLDLASGGNPTLPTLFAPTLTAGTLGGALLGPRGVRGDWTATWRSRFAIRIRLALAAILIGAPVVALQLGFSSHLARTERVGLLGDLLGSLVFVPLGVVFVGPIALPFTYGAAVLWTWVMRRVT